MFIQQVLQLRNRKRLLTQSLLVLVVLVVILPLRGSGGNSVFNSNHSYRWRPIRGGGNQLAGINGGSGGGSSRGASSAGSGTVGQGSNGGTGGTYSGGGGGGAGAGGSNGATSYWR